MMGEERKKGGVDATTLPCEIQPSSNGGPPPMHQQNGAPANNVHAANNNANASAPVAPGTNVETLPRAGKQGDLSAGFLRTARAGQLEKVLEYLDSGVDINTSNQNGLNALHLAAKDGHLEIVKELLTRGAIVDAATKKGNTALHIASLAGQEEVVHLLVERGASVNAQSQNGFTPLYMAAQENHDSVVKFLLNKGANQTLATEDGFTPLAVAMQQGHDKVVAVLLENDTRGKVRLPALHIAAKKDDCKAAALLLQKDHNPDVTSKSGFTPLHIAAHYGNDRIASLLYDKGADVNFAAKHNITPMHVAAKWGKIKMVNLLISKGANIEAKTRDGLTPLHCAARSGHHEVVDILIEKGAPIGSKTKNGLAPLHMASQGDHVDAARILLYHRAPVDEVTVDYLTALHVAAHCGHVRVAKLLLDRNADPNARALNGFTPLHIACKKNRIKVVELLLKHKASIEATTESGLTPLHVASFMGCMNIVIYLLQHEASPDIPTVRGETPLHLAARANQTDIIRILLRNGAQVDARAREEQTPLHVASRLGNVDIVMLLLQHGADVDATTKDVYTPLHIAAKEGQEEVASVLLDNGASHTTTTKKGFTPLHLAAKYGNMNVARLLLQKDAPVDAQGKNGVTPLHVASHYDHQNVALLLLDKGASPHAMAKNGHTPLHIAARKNQMDIATTLLEYGAKANAESKAGFTPLHLSAQEGHTDMSTLLIEHKADTNHKAKNGLTPLHLCAQEDKVNVASILVKNGAQIDAKTKAGYTPLHVAAHFGQAQMVRFLLSSGASVNCSTSAGYTPLHHAAQQGHTLVINLLLEGRAQPNLVTKNGQTALDIAQKLGYITVVETLKVVTETIITTSHTITIEEKYKVQAPESMQETFMSDSEDEGGGDEIGMAAMNVYGQPPHAQHVYLPSYYQGQLTYTREDPMLSDHHQYQYMTGDDMKSMGDDSMRVNVTDDERDNRHSGVPTITEMITKESCYRQNVANLKPDNIDINRHPVHVGIPSWRNFLVSFLVDARGGAMRGCRHSGVRVIVPPRKATMPMRVTCRYLKRDKLTHPPPLMEGEALASRILELAPVAAKFLGPVIIEVPHFASLRGKEREIVILRSDNGETWREHTLEASEEAVQDVLNESFEGEELSQLEDLQTSRIVRILTVDFPHYFAVVSRIRQEVHAVGPEGGTVSSSAVPQVQAIFPPAALTKKIRVGLQAHPIPAELVAKLLGNRVAVSPIVTVEPRRRKFHKPISLTVPLPQAANKGMINQYSGDAPTLRLLCSITGLSHLGGQSRAVWEDVTGSTPLTFLKDCVSFTTTVSARFWLMDCRNISEATKMATELYTHATHVPFMAKFVVFAKRTDPLEARLRVFCMTDDKEDKTLEHQEHFTEVAKSRDVEVLEGKTQYLEFAGNLIPVLKSGEQLQLPFRAFKENRIPFTVRIKDPDAADMMGRIMFMNEPKVAKGEPPQTPICTLNILLPDKISPGGNSELDLLELSKNYSFLRDGGLSRPDAIHRATIRLTDIANLLDKDWENLALELNLTPNEISQIKEEHPDKTAQQATAMFKLWQSNGNKATGNTLEKALNKIGREDIVKKCIFNVELVTDDVEKAVARVRLDQPGFDNLKDELGPSRDTSLRRDATMDPKMDPDFEEPDRMKDSESVEDLSITGAQNSTNQRITITNGTVYNATSTPIKDKYASDEKELVDDMSDFIEHKYHTTDTMMKQSRDELDDDNKKREEVLEEAKRIVSGVKRDAEKEKIKLSKKGWSVVYDNDVRKNDEVGNVLKQQEGSFSVDSGGVSEIPVIRQQCIIGTNGDRTITTITTRTIITTGEDDGTDLSNLAIHGEDSHDVTDFSDSRLSINDSGAVRIDKSSGVSPKTHTVNETTEIAGRGKDLSKNIARNLDETVSGKKDKASRMFTGIFKTTKSKKNKSKDSRDVSLDSGDDEIKVSTAKLLDDIRRMSESTVDDPDLASTYTSTGQIENEFVGKNSAESARLNESEKNPESPSFFNKLRSPKSKGESKIRSKDKLLRQIPSSDNGEKSKTGATKSVVSMKPHDGEPVESAQSKEETHDTRVTEDLGYGKHGVTKDLDLGLNDPENSVLQRDEKDHGKSSGLLNIFRNPKSKMKKSKAEKVSKSLDSCSDPTDKRFATNDDDNIKTETEKFLDHNRYTLDITDLRKPDSVNLREDSVALEKQEQLAPSVVEKSEESIARDPVDDLYSKKSHHSASRQKGQAHYPEREVNDGESVARGGSELGDPSLKAEGGVVIEPKANDGTPNDPAKLNTLKGKEKAGGILSGILKSAKHAAEDITQEVKDFAGKARKEAEEEKDKDKVDSKNVSTSIKYEIEERVGGIKGDTLEGIRGPSATGEDSNEKVKIVVKTNEASHENSSISSISIVDKNTPKSGADLLLNTSITESTRNPDIDAVGHPVNQKLKKGKAKTGAIFSGIFNKGSKETRNAAVDDAIVLHGGSHPDPTGEIESKNISIGEVVENDEKNDNKVNSADLNSAQSSPVNVTGSIGLKVEKDINPELAIPSHNDDPGITQICKEERKGKIEKKNKGLLSGILKGAKNTAGDVAHVVGELEEEAEEEAIEDEKLMALYTSQISGNPTKSRKSAGYNDDLREENLMKDEEENMREKSPGSRVVLEGSGPQRKSNKLTERIVVCHAGEESSSDNDDIKKTKDLLEDMKSTASSWMVDVSQAPSHLSQNESLGTHVDTAEKKNRKKGGILSGFFKKVNSPNVEVVEESSSSSGGEKITTEDVKGETKKDVDTVKEQIGSIVGETDKNISNAPDGFANFSLSKNDSDPSIAGTLDLQRISKETGMEASIPAILEEKRKKKENDTEAPITGEIPSRKSKEKTTGFLAGIFKLPKQDSKEIATRSQDSENGTYGKEVNNEIGGTLHVDETVNADACGADEGLESKQIIVTYDSEFSRNATKDLLRDMQHNSTIPDTEISANEIDHQVESGISSEKNLKRKNPLSDLIQFPKSAAQKISHDIQEFVRETKREALEDKMKSKAKSGKISVDSEIDTDRVSKDQSHSSYLGLDTEKPTSYGGHDSSGKEAATKSGDDALKIGKSTYSLDEETSGNSEVSTKKNKAKTTKLLSGIFKSTKSKSEDITPHMTASSAVGVEIVAHKPKTIKPKVDVSTDGQKEESIHDMNDHSRKSDLNDPGPRVESSSVLLTEGNDAIGIPSPKRGDVSPGKNGNEQGRVDQKKSKKSKGIFTGLLDGAKHMAGEIVHDAEDFAKKTKVDELTEESKIESEEPKTNESRFLNVKKVGVPIIGLESPKESTRMPGTSIEKEIRSKNEHPFVHSTDKNSAGEAELSVGEVILQPKSSNQPILKKKKSRSLGGILRAAKDPSKPVYDDPITSLESVTTEDGLGNLIQDDKTATKQFLEDIKSSLMVSELPLNIILSEIGGDSSSRVTKTTGIRQSVSEDAEDDPNDKCAGEIMPGSDEHPGRENKHKSKGFMSGIFKTRKQSVAEVEGKSHRVKSSNIEGLENQAMIASHQQFDGVTSGDGIPEGGVVVDSNVGLTQISLERDRSINDGQTESTHGSTPINNDRGRRTPLLLGEMENVACKIRNEEKEVKMNAKDAIEDVKASENVIQGIPSSMANETIGQMKEEKAHSTKAVDKSVPGGESTNTSVEIEIEGHTSPQAKKKVKKARGLLSGVFKGARNTAEGVAHEVEDLLEESERKIVEEERKFTSKVIETSDHARDELGTRIGDSDRRVSDTARYIKDKVDDRLEEGRLKLHEGLKELDRVNIQDQPNIKLKATSSDETVNRASRDSMEPEDKHPKMKKHKEKGRGFLSNIIKNAKTPAGVAGDEKGRPLTGTEEEQLKLKEKSDDVVEGGGEVVEGSIGSEMRTVGRANMNIGSDSVNRETSSANKMMELDDGKDSVVLADHVIGDHGTSHPRKKDKKSGGLLSGLFKSAKNAAEGYVEVTEQTVLEEERKVKADLNEKALKAQAELDAQIYELDEAISETGHDLKKEIDIGIEKEKLRINEQVEALKVGNSHDGTESVNQGISSANETVEHDDGKDSVVLADRVIGEHGTSHPRKKDKKSGGLLSGLFKSAKNAAEGYVEVTEQTILEEERKVKADLNEKALKAQAELDAQIYELDEAISETGHDLKKEIDTGIEQEKLRINEQVEALKVGNSHDNTESVNRGIPSANETVERDDGKDSVVLADRVIGDHGTSHPRKKDKKSGGLLSGLFKSAKNATEDYVEVTEQNVLEEERKVKADLNEKALEARDGAGTQIHKLDKAIVETGKDLKREVDAGIEEEKLRVNEQMDRLKIGNYHDGTESVNREISSANKAVKLDDGKNSVVLADRSIDEHESSPPREKDNKSGGLLSGLFKSAKNATEDCVEVTKQAIPEEESKVKAELSGKALVVRDRLDTQIHELDGAISETEHDLKKEIDARVEKGKLRVHKEMEGWEEGDPRDSTTFLNREMSSANKMMELDDGKDSVVLVDRAIDDHESSHPRKKDKKSGGLLSGLFRSAKNAAKDHVEITEQTSSEEERKVKADLSGKTTEVRDGLDAHIPGLNKAISETEQNLKKEIHADVERGKLRVREQIEKLEEGKAYDTVSADRKMVVPDEERPGIVDLRPSSSEEAHNMNKKNKERDGGFFLGLFKGSKTSAENVKNGGKEFAEKKTEKPLESEERIGSTIDLIERNADGANDLSERNFDLPRVDIEFSNDKNRIAPYSNVRVEHASEGCTGSESFREIDDSPLAGENNSDTLDSYKNNDHKLPLPKELEKKPRGFLTGILRTTKNALGGVTREVENLVDETKQKVIDEELNVASQVDKVAKTIENNSEILSEEAKEKVSTRKQEIMDQISSSVQEIESESQKVHDKVLTSLGQTDKVGEAAVGTNVIINTQKEENDESKRKQKTSGFFSGIFKNAKSTTVEEHSDGKSKSGSELPNSTAKRKESEPRLLVSSGHDIPATVCQSSNLTQGDSTSKARFESQLDSGKNIRFSGDVEDTEFSSNEEDPKVQGSSVDKSKDPMKQFLSDILGTAKVIPENTAYHVNEFLEETRREASEEIRRIMTSSQRSAMAPENLTNDLGIINNDQKQLSDKDLSLDTQTNEDMTMSSKKQKMLGKPEIPNQIEGANVDLCKLEKTAQAISTHKDRHEKRDSEDAIDSISGMSSDELKSSPEKEKPGNFFSNLFKGAKNTATGVAQDVRIITNKIENEVIENEDQARESSQENVLSAKKFVDVASQDIDISSNSSGIDMARSEEMRTKQVTLDKRNVMTNLPELKMRKNQPGLDGTDDSFGASEQKEVKSHGKKEKNKAGGFFTSLLKSANHPKKGTASESSVNPQIFSEEVMDVADNIESKSQEADNDIQRTLDKTKEDIDELIDTCGKRSANTGAEINQKVSEISTKVSLIGKDTSEELQSVGERIEVPPESSRDETLFQISAAHDKPMAKSSTDPQLVGNSSHFSLNVEKRKKPKLLAGFFTSAKQAVGGVAHGIDEFVEETKEEVLKAEEKIKADSQKKASDLNTVAVDSVIDFNNLIQQCDAAVSPAESELKRDVEYINTAAGSTKDGVRERTDDIKEELNNAKALSIGTGSDILSKIESSASQGKFESDHLKTEISKQVSSSVSEGKEKSKGILSGFLKGSKRVTGNLMSTVDEPGNEMKGSPKKHVTLETETKQIFDPVNDKMKVDPDEHPYYKSTHESMIEDANETVGKMASVSTISNSNSNINPDIRHSSKRDIVLANVKTSVLPDEKHESIIEGAVAESASLGPQGNPKSTDIVVDDTSISLIHDAHKSESDSAKGSLKREYSDEREGQKTSKSKSGVLSGIIKKTKGASHKIAKELDHATESLKGATEKFWEDAKRESMDSKRSGSYDVTPSLIDPELTKDEIASNSDLGLEPSNPMYSPLTIAHDTESHIPKVIQSCHICEESTVQIVQESITIVQSEVSSSFSHSEPQAHQTVTTVIKKSVRTASTPPPSPAEFTDDSSQEITEEAERRAQVLIDARSLGKSGHESAEFDGVVERHAPTLTNQPDHDLGQGNVAKVSSDPSDLRLDLKNSASPKNDQNSKILKSIDRTEHHLNNEPLSRENSLEITSDSHSSKEKTTTSKASQKKVSEEISPQRVEIATSQESHNRESRDLYHESSSFMDTIVETVDGARDPELDRAETASSRHSTRERQDTWRTMSSSGEAKASAELWDTQFSADISPVSGYDDAYAKNGSRHGTISDTDSDGSPNRRRRTMSSGKRRTMGSSSDSDVALHEGAELSPMEDDQENDLLQQSDPTFVETTTTEIDPDTHERITRVTRTMTSTHGAIDDREELRDSMHKIVDDFISEERRGQ